MISSGKTVNMRYAEVSFMKVVVWKSNKFVGCILRKVFKVKKTEA